MGKGKKRKTHLEHFSERWDVVGEDEKWLRSQDITANSLKTRVVEFIRYTLCSVCNRD